MIDLIREAASIQEFIESRGWDFYFIGGIPVQVWGQPRLTQDIDFTLFTNLTNEPAYLAAFLERYRPKFSDAAEYALTNRVMPMFTEEDLIILKTTAGRGRDWIDIESVIIRQEVLDWDYIIGTLERVTDDDGLPPKIENLKDLKLKFYQK